MACNGMLLGELAKAGWDVFFKVKAKMAAVKTLGSQGIVVVVEGTGLASGNQGVT